MLYVWLLKNRFCLWVSSRILVRVTIVPNPIIFILLKFKPLLIMNLRLGFEGIVIDSTSHCLIIINMVYKVKILGHELRDDKVTYTILVVNEGTTEEKTFRYRYSQLKDIHEEMEKLLNKLKLPIILPEFPARKVFGSTNKSEEAILERKKELAAVLFGDKLVPRRTDHAGKAL